MTSARSLNPAWLSPGTEIGGWRVEDWAGRGVHGTVYRAVPVGSAHPTPVALKVAMMPGDPRMAREGELLSRLRHPSIPRLWARGEWHHPNGSRYPYIAMEWVDGVPLYEWARPFGPTPRQVLRLSAQLVSALHAVHAQGAVHRDVKGGNILVRRADGRAMLMDLGTCNYAGAQTLTPPTTFPGTPVYLSPEAGEFRLRYGRDASARYAAGPADDLYALGVTLCHWVTGEYPVLLEPWKDEQGLWHLDRVLAPRALLSLEPLVRDWILRLLSVRPGERGTAAQWVETLEWASGRSSTRSPVPGFPARLRRPWMMAAAAVMALTTSAWWAVSEHGTPKPSGAASTAAHPDQADAGTAGLGETAAATSKADAPELSGVDVLSEEPLPEPVPGQLRPDSKGRCPRKQHVALNGGCWVRPPIEREDCEATGGSFFKEACYLPIIPPRRTPTSSPQESPP